MNSVDRILVSHCLRPFKYKTGKKEGRKPQGRLKRRKEMREKGNTYLIKIIYNKKVKKSQNKIPINQIQQHILKHIHQD